MQRHGDLISGNVKRVDYQKDQPDRFHHSYTYDADNRITEVETSADGQNWHRDARYFYYPHGPLERVELGEHLVQGMDYAYTLQGWLKGINSNLLAPHVDMGGDGALGDTDPSNDLIGRDAYGLSLGYYGDEDFKAIGPEWSTIDNRPFAPIGPAGTLNDEQRPLYNGNIAHTVNTLQPFGPWNSGNGAQGQVLAQVYRYDQLNRLKQARGVEGLVTNNRWQTVTDLLADRYRSTYTYDANGNITAAQRYDGAGNWYDDFSYKYEKRNGKLERNRLYQLYDDSDAGDLYVNEANGAQDIAYTPTITDTQDPDYFDATSPTINEDYNYAYDQLGNLVRDDREGIANIEWTVAGKVKLVEKSDGTELRFAYGADGQRLWKEVAPPVLDDSGYREYYIRDAQGNIMATYRSQLLAVPNSDPTAYTASLLLNGRPMYGSSRLGSFARTEELYNHAVVTDPGPDMMQPVDLNYELTDHLGNVCAVVTGRLLDGNAGGTPKQAELVSAQGYEAGGSLLPGRNYSSSSYAFGFNGMRKDDEIHGATGTSYDFGARLYDPRVGRWLSLDPLAKKYAELSPYNFTANNPILFVDVDGEDFFVRNRGTQRKFTAAMSVMFGGESKSAFTFKRGKLSIDLTKIHGNLSPEQEFVLSKINQVATDTKTKVSLRGRLLGSSESVKREGAKADPNYDSDYDIFVNINHPAVDSKLFDTEDGQLKSGDPGYEPSKTTIWSIIFGHEMGHTTEDAYGNAPMDNGNKTDQATNFRRAVGFENKVRSILGLNPRKGTGELHGGYKGSEEPTPAAPLPKD